MSTLCVSVSEPTSVTEVREVIGGEDFVADMREVLYEPQHRVCDTHWACKVTLCDGCDFAVCFTDRQLGWLPLVQLWDRYEQECTDGDIAGTRPLWTKHAAITRFEDLDNESFCEVWDDDDKGKYWAELIEDGKVPPFDFALEAMPDNWVPKENLSSEERERMTLLHKCYLGESVNDYWVLWRDGHI
jgi:hypothetical protein